MSMRPVSLPGIPPATAAVARAAFPAGTLAMRLRDELGAVYQNTDFVEAFARRGAPAASPGVLALVSVLQYTERLTDRQAADAVRGRIDWKYALGMELTDPGFEFSALAGFRARLVEHGMEDALLDVILARCTELGLLRSGGRVRTDSTHVLACVRDLNRVEMVTETLRAALEALSVAAPAWLAATGLVTRAWLERYGQRADSYRLPKGEAPRASFAAQVGADGYALLDAIDQHDSPHWLAEVPAVEILRVVWARHFEPRVDGTARYRDAKELPRGAQRLVSPYDTDARCAVKRTTIWDGYKAHFTETCDDDAPHLVVATATTPAPVDDGTMTASVHQDLLGHGLSPTEHYVDTGYTSAALLVAACADGIDLVGPVKAAGGRGPAGPASYTVDDFQINWEHQKATCPQGKENSRWIETTEHGQPRVHIDFYRADCPACPTKALCTNARFRVLTLLPREQHEALHRRRSEQETDAWKARYTTRAGIEGTISQAVNRTGARRTRYRGLPKTRLHTNLVAATLNLIRLDAWLTGTPLANTRTSHFSQLALTPAT
jgi:transposase